MSTIAPGELDGSPVITPDCLPTYIAMKAARRWLIANPDKVPHYVAGQRRSGALDCPADLAQLASYEAAQAALLRAEPGWLLGFALGPDGNGGYWQGLDFDKVRENGLADLANTAPGYVEMSPSGAGAHAIGYGIEFDTLGSNGSGIEAYAAARYFTVTERIIRDNGLTCLAGFVAEALASRHRAKRPAVMVTQALSVPDGTKRDLRSALQAIPADDYHLWVRMGLALAELGDIGRALWLEWSALSEKYDASQAARKWETFQPTDTGHQAVFAESQRHGWLNPASGAAQALVAPMAGPSDPVAAASAWSAAGGGTGRLRLLLDSDLDALPPLRWLVKNIVPDAGIGAIYGPSGTYKSFLTLDLLAHISNGQEWFGHRVKAAPAVYVPFEGQGGIPKRIRAWRQAQSASRHPERLITLEPDAGVSSWVAVIMEPLNLREAADRDALVATLTEQGWAGGVLCIDTLAHASAGIEENSSAMGEMIGIFRDLQQRLGGVILLVHHSGKDESRGMRGWSGLHAAMDFVVECQAKGESGTKEAAFSLAKVKDGTTGTSFPFKMQSVILGFDEDGDAMTSLTVCAAEAGEKPEHPFKTDKAGLRDIDAGTSAKDDTFVFDWAHKQVVANNYPSKNSLKGQLPAMKAIGYSITQDRVLAAIERLLAAGRLNKEPKSPNGNAWLRPIESTPGGSPA